MDLKDDYEVNLNYFLSEQYYTTTKTIEKFKNLSRHFKNKNKCLYIY